MKIAMIASAFALVVLTLAPPATAAHCCGPCTHEWGEILLAAPGDYKEGGFRQALGNAGTRAGGCLDNGLGFDPCDVIGCDRLLP